MVNLTIHSSRRRQGLISIDGVLQMDHSSIP